MTRERKQRRRRHPSDRAAPPPCFGRPTAPWRWAALAAACALALGAGCPAHRASTDDGRRRDDGADARGADEPPGRLYTVKAGDTAWDIARRHGLSVEEIVEVNGLESADLLQPGQLLFLPDSGERPPLPPEDAPPVQRSASVEPQPASAKGFGWPLHEGVILREFRLTGRLPHDGLLFAAPKGTPVLAAGDGEVLYAGDEGTAFGLLVLVRHDDDLVTVYAHLDRAAVQPGARVRRGQAVGTVGTSGRVEAPRLHFQVRRGRTPIDPLEILPPP